MVLRIFSYFHIYIYIYTYIDKNKVVEVVALLESMLLIWFLNLIDVLVLLRFCCSYCEVRSFLYHEM